MKLTFHREKLLCTYIGIRNTNNTSDTSSISFTFSLVCTQTWIPVGVVEVILLSTQKNKMITKYPVHSFNTTITSEQDRIWKRCSRVIMPATAPERYKNGMIYMNIKARKDK